MKKEKKNKIKQYLKDHNIIPQNQDQIIQEIIINDILKIIEEEDE